MYQGTLFYVNGFLQIVIRFYLSLPDTHFYALTIAWIYFQGISTVQLREKNVYQMIKCVM